MPRARNPQHLCKQSSTPETKDERKMRLKRRRAEQLARTGGFVVENPKQYRERRAHRTKILTPRLVRYVLKVGKTYDRRGKR